EKLDKAGREMLVRVAGDPDPKVRGEAARALRWDYAELDKAGRDILRQLATDPNSEVRWKATWGNP
ncbi:MAG TPA: HEAT repeat domain-containing protein, partial [Planctomycetota bacterium]|nr:HEAT repeat domain-containing protein [Planctomycetota bacterium]